ncbi:MAG: hypothetical protein Phog2KO_31190 [Phototrophicaceae bacterium]
MTIATKDTTSVTIERLINASPERLHRAFTSSDELNIWFCNNSFIQAREGGHYLFVWNQEQYSATGFFKEFIANEKFSLTWRSTWEGTESDYAEVFTITLDEVDEGTKVTLLHEGMPEEGKDSYLGQWNKRLDDLKLFIETGAMPNIVNRVIIGIFPQAVPEDRLEDLDLETGTLSMVARLVPDYGAEKAGIEVGDIITHMNGHKVSPTFNMNQTVAGMKPNDQVEVTLVRGEETMTLKMPLSPYPVPDMPENYAGLADIVAPQYDAIMSDLHDLFDNASEDDTNKAPAEGEWSAKMTLAHLIYSEQQVQEQIGAHLANGRPQHWSGNSDARLQAIIDASPTNAEMLATMRREYDETLAIWRNFPEDVANGNTSFLWLDTFNIQGWIQHSQGHMPQMKEAIES